MNPEYFIIIIVATMIIGAIFMLRTNVSVHRDAVNVVAEASRIAVSVVADAAREALQVAATAAQKEIKVVAAAAAAAVAAEEDRHIPQIESLLTGIEERGDRISQMLDNRDV